MEHTALFRFPFGTCNAETLNAVNDAGLLAIQWDVVSGDPAKAATAEALRQGVVSHVNRAPSWSCMPMAAAGIRPRRCR